MGNGDANTGEVVDLGSSTSLVTGPSVSRWVFRDVEPYAYNRPFGTFCHAVLNPVVHDSGGWADCIVIRRGLDGVAVILPVDRLKPSFTI